MHAAATFGLQKADGGGGAWRWLEIALGVRFTGGWRKVNLGVWSFCFVVGAKEYTDLCSRVRQQATALQQVFEDVFDHRQWTAFLVKGGYAVQALLHIDCQVILKVLPHARQVLLDRNSQRFQVFPIANTGQFQQLW